MFSRSSSLFALIVIICVLSCTQSREFPGDKGGDQIHFGQGGGLSGVVNYFVLYDDGRLFQRGFRDSLFTYVDTWDDAFTSQLFSSYHALHLDTVEHYQPGDLYYFIDYRAKGKPVKPIAWGRPGHHPQENIVRYYNLLYKSTKPKS